MSMEYTYFRKYIILKNDYTNISNINPKGYAKVEIRGNKGIINFNVENCEKEEYYRVYLLKEENGQVYEEDLGRIFADDHGRLRRDITLNLRELESKGFSIDKIDAILIRRGIYVLLGGYIDKDNKVLDRSIKRLLSEEKQEIDVEEAFDLPEEELIEEEKLIEEEIIEEDVEQDVQKDFHLPEEELIDEEIVDTVQVLDHQEQEAIEEEIIEEEVQEEVFEEPSLDKLEAAEDNVGEGTDLQEEEPETTVDGKDPYMESYESLEYARRLHHRNQMTKYILSILRFFPQVQPLKIYLHNYSWWRIEDDGTEPYRGFLPYYNYLMSSDYKYPFLHNSATCMNQIRKYGHYLFGLYKEGKETKYYVYGVPGKFTQEEHPFKGITGFNTWYDSLDGIGYWILYIDPITGKVIYPINPMVPSY